MNQKRRADDGDLAVHTARLYGTAPNAGPQEHDHTGPEQRMPVQLLWKTALPFKFLCLGFCSSLCIFATSLFITYVIFGILPALPCYVH